MTADEHRELQQAAVAADGRAHRALLDGDEATAAAAFAQAAQLYRRSWEAAPPGAFGRLIGLAKAAVLAGAGAREAAEYVRAQIGPEPPSPPAAYALALAALVLGDRDAATRHAEAMRPGGPAFARAADAIAAPSGDAFDAAIAGIEEDFATRAEHLTGVPIADTALVLRRLRG